MLELPVYYILLYSIVAAAVFFANVVSLKYNNVDMLLCACPAYMSVAMT